MAHEVTNVYYSDSKLYDSQGNNALLSSVPDPEVFWPPGFGSVNVLHGSGFRFRSGSGFGSGSGFWSYLLNKVIQCKNS
jgi:hypothetical protein